MFKRILLVMAILSMPTYADEDCESVTKDTASAVSFGDRNAAIEILSDKDQVKCLLPEYVVKLKNLVGKTRVKEKPILKFPRGDISNPANMRKLCSHELERILDVQSDANMWSQVSAVGFSYLNYQCTIVVDGDYIDAMIQL